MSVRKRLCEQAPESVMVSDPATLGAQLELVHMILDWLPQRYPTRFAIDWASGTVQTLTPGYTHTFLVSDYVSTPAILILIFIDVF